MWEGGIQSQFQRGILTKAFVLLFGVQFSMAPEEESLSGVMEWPFLVSEC